MIVTTHFETLDGAPLKEKDTHLLNVWKKSWELRGFTCILTNKDIFNNLENEDLELYKRFQQKIQSFPSVNAPGFDRAGFMRWFAAYLIALKENAPICVSECDVMNYSLVREDLSDLSATKFNIGDRDGCPAFVYTSASVLKYLIGSITNYELTCNDNHEGKPHISDQNYISLYFIKDEIYHSVQELVGSFMTTEQWLTYKLVHYGTPFMMMNKLDTSIPKYLYIQRYRPV